MRRTDKIDSLIGQSAEISRIRDLIIPKLAASDVPVLLIGETGTGKELVARLIHDFGNRGPFVTIDCSTLPETLLESELFGYTRGAFTGASVGKAGLIEQSNGGTAFFDEIAELPTGLQAKLLRLLQEGEFRPVGSVACRKVKFRLISATNRDLLAAVDEGAFRADLYHRLSAVELRLPPLRERKEDIPALVLHFLARHGVGHAVSPQCLDAMLEYDWPGNVRELQNVVRTMTALSQRAMLKAEDFIAALGSRARRAKPPASMTTGLASPPPAHLGLPTLAQIERDAIAAALEYTQGDRSKAARLLGIGRTTLYRKVKSYTSAA
jgi:DNA-binding NtrC family response regulator